MDFLKGYIGLSSKRGVVAESGLYVDALPDISIETINNIVAADESTTDKWLEIENRTLLKFRTLFINEVNKCHHVHDIAICECLIRENKSAIATALWYLMGAEVMLERTTSSRINVATIDRDKPKRIRDYFESQFKEELAVAVNSIDIHTSSCFPPEECPEPKEISRFATMIM